MATYTVKKGDTLSAIAKKYGTTYQEIAKANGISNPNVIHVGQTLKIGNDTPTQKPATTTPKVTTPTTPTTIPEKEFTYKDFKQSDEATSADKYRQDLQTQQPGDFTYDPYEKSDIVKQAEALLQQQIANKPGEYQSNWQAQLDETLNKILNREKFTYDLNGDALYQQYKDQYMLQGQQAMMDTMGQAQAATGGYGNSYAQTVGQQTYQGYLQQLNDKVPELYQLALDQYNQEGQDLYNQYGLYADREEQDYGRYRDALSDYNTELSRLTEDARYQAETDYNRYMDAYNMAYGQHRDEVTDWKDALNRADSEYWNLYNRDYGMHIDDKNFEYGKFTDDRTYDYNKSVDDRNYQYQLERDAIADALNERQMKIYEEELKLAQDKFSYEKSNQGGGDDPDDQTPPDDEDDNKGNPGDEKPTYDSIVADCNAYIASGASRSEISSYLRSALKSGYITQKQYNSLKSTFLPSGSSGGRPTY